MVDDCRCPSCGFQILNRRYPRCERCAKPLPEALLFSPEELAQLDAASAANQREIERLRMRSNEKPKVEARGGQDGGTMVVVTASAFASASASGADGCSGADSCG